MSQDFITIELEVEMVTRAIVIGTGWAGEGHTKALQANGVEVVALCGRTPEPARAMALKLGIQEVRFDWQQALVELQPDIVSIATPPAVHAEIAIFAAAQGCHIVCEKSLGLNADEAQAMLHAVELAGVKHAYGATCRFVPATIYAKSLLSQGLIGPVRTIESIHHFNTSPLLPFSWFHQLSQGGGALFLDFTHFLTQVLFITGGKIQAVAGEAHRLIERAPVGAPVHDLRLGLIPLDLEQAQAGAWQDVDADMGYTVLARLQMPGGNVSSVLFQDSEMGTGRYPNAVNFYGEKGSLRLPGFFFPEAVEFYDPALQTWVEMSIPDEISNALACTEDPVQNAWCYLFRQFVADVRGEGYGGYPTFQDGWIANTIIDIIRNSPGWVPVPEHLS
jgi:predicted dehydrogenase